MKILLGQQQQTGTGHTQTSGNETLRLAAEILADDGNWPKVDVEAASLRHWNGSTISIDKSDIDELMHDGLLDGLGNWTRRGRLLLARFADIETSKTSKVSRSFV